MQLFVSDASRSKIITDIEALRAISILLVISHHYIRFFPEISHDLRPVLSFWSGVDIFLAISGFLIGKQLLNIRQSSQMSDGAYAVEIVAFWIRRIWRIWPTAWLWLVPFLIIPLVVGDNTRYGAFSDNLHQVVAAVTGVANFFYLNPYPHTSIQWDISVYWSLSLEEQFYLFLPILLIFTNSSRSILYFIIFAVLLQVFIQRFEAGGYSENGTWSLGWPFRTDALLLGVGVALSFRSARVREIFEPTFLLAGRFAPYISTIIIIIIISVMSSDRIVYFSTSITAIMAFILIWSASYDRNYILPDSVFKRVLIWIGARSYSLYVVHGLAGRLSWSVVTRIYGTNVDPAYGEVVNVDGRLKLFLLSCVISLIFAEANYRFIEVPLRKYGAKKASEYRQAHLRSRSPTSAM